MANPNFDYDTTALYVLHINVSDGDLFDVQDLTIDIIEVEFGPIIWNMPTTISLGELTSGVVFTANITDPDGGLITYHISTSPATGVFSIDAAGRLLSRTAAYATGGAAIPRG